MEEECGNLKRARKLLKIGLKFRPLHENLFTRALKLEEKLENYDGVRKLLSSLSNCNPNQNKNYALFIEGAFFQARMGNIDRARMVFSFLLRSCSATSNIYQQYIRMESRIGNVRQAYDICYRALEQSVKSSPLCFEALKLAQNLYLQGQMQEKALKGIISDVLINTSRDSHWKICMEVAQIHLRLQVLNQQREQRCFDKVRQFISEAALRCNETSVWKVWTLTSRLLMKISIESDRQSDKNSRELAIKMISRAIDSVSKQFGTVLLQLSKIHQFNGDFQTARSVMSYACQQNKGDWKIFFESINFEIRNCQYKQALKQVKSALQIHFATGRIWASYIQILRLGKIRNSGLLTDQSNAFSVFKQALYEIPKSGQVWCEGARILMNPCAVDQQNRSLFDLLKAKKYLNFAIKFTPQYGDSFIELLKIYLIEKEMKASSSSCSSTTLSCCQIQEAIKSLKLQCCNSEPNYGNLWFHCKKRYVDTSRQGLHQFYKLFQ